MAQLDPSIILQAGRGVVPLKSPDEIADEQMQRQVRSLQLRQAQQGIADDQAYRDVLRSGVTGADQISALQKAGLGKQAMEAQKFQSEQQKTNLERGKAVGEALRFGATGVMASPTEQNAISMLDDVISRFGVPATTFDAGKARIYAARNDPQQIRQLMMQLGAKAEEALGKIQSVDLGMTQQQQRVNPVTGQVEVLASQAKSATPTALLNAQTSSENSLRADARAREFNALKSQELAQNRQLAQEQKNLDRVDKKVTAFSNQLDKTNIPQFESLLGDIEADIARFADIPGYGGVMGNLPTFMQTEEGRALRQKIATLRNLTLKDRSGAAVTNQELTRLLEELGTGYFKTDDDLKRGLSGIRRNVDAVKQNVIAGVDDDTLKEYQARGGMALTRGPQGQAKSSGAKIKPRLGAVVDGYLFKGGDPNDKASWEPVK